MGIDAVVQHVAHAFDGSERRFVLQNQCRASGLVREPGSTDAAACVYERFCPHLSSSSVMQRKCRLGGAAKTVRQ